MSISTETTSIEEIPSTQEGHSDTPPITPLNVDEAEGDQNINEIQEQVDDSVTTLSLNAQMAQTHPLETDNIFNAQNRPHNPNEKPVRNSFDELILNSVKNNPEPAGQLRGFSPRLGDTRPNQPPNRDPSYPLQEGTVTLLPDEDGNVDVGLDNTRALRHQTDIDVSTTENPRAQTVPLTTSTNENPRIRRQGINILNHTEREQLLAEERQFAVHHASTKVTEAIRILNERNKAEKRTKPGKISWNAKNVEKHYIDVNNKRIIFLSTPGGPSMEVIPLDDNGDFAKEGERLIVTYGISKSAQGNNILSVNNVSKQDIKSKKIVDEENPGNWMQTINNYLPDEDIIQAEIDTHEAPEIKAREAQTQKIQKLISTNQEELRDLEAGVAQNEQQKNIMQERIEALKQLITRHEQAIEEDSANIETLTNQINEAQEKLADLQEKPLFEDRPDVDALKRLKQLYAVSNNDGYTERDRIAARQYIAEYNSLTTDEEYGEFAINMAEFIENINEVENAILLNRYRGPALLLRLYESQLSDNDPQRLEIDNIRNRLITFANEQNEQAIQEEVRRIYELIGNTPEETNQQLMEAIKSGQSELLEEVNLADPENDFYKYLQNINFAPADIQRFLETGQLILEDTPPGLPEIANFIHTQERLRIAYNLFNPTPGEVINHKSKEKKIADRLEYLDLLKGIDNSLLFTSQGTPDFHTLGTQVLDKDQEQNITLESFNNTVHEFLEEHRDRIRSAAIIFYNDVLHPANNPDNPDFEQYLEAFRNTGEDAVVTWQAAEQSIQLLKDEDITSEDLEKCIWVIQEFNEEFASFRAESTRVNNQVQESIQDGDQSNNGANTPNNPTQQEQAQDRVPSIAA